MSIVTATLGQFGLAQFAWAAAIATLGACATFPWAREGSVWPLASALAATAATAALWHDPAIVIDHARTIGAARYLPATYGEVSLWSAATALGAAGWAAASALGLAVSAAEG